MDYDAELRLLNQALRGAYGIERRHHVLDIGCGAGQTTREAARMAPEGGALGIDTSLEAIVRARDRARAERTHNVTFVRADAAVYTFPPERFDVAVSRFGTMFFDAPVDAFVNIRRALRRGGRLVMMVWQAHERNEWSLEVEVALGGPIEPEGRTSRDPFSLADPAVVQEILDAAGFVEVTFTDVHQPVYYGPDTVAALEWVRGFACAKEALARLDAASGERTVERLREALRAHAAADGVWLDSRAWIVEAKRP